MQTNQLIFQSAVMEHISRNRMSSSTNFWELRANIDRVLVTHDRTFILVQSSCPAIQGQKQKETLVFDVSKVPTTAGLQPSSTDSDEPVSTIIPIPRPLHSIINSTSSLPRDDECQELYPVSLSSELTSQIKIPLSFLSRDRLVFLDQNHWLCSWRLPVPSNNTPRMPNVTDVLEKGTREIKQHYFFPSDWISPDSVTLCTVMMDGTVLYPRNGKVAVVKCSTLRD